MRNWMRLGLSGLLLAALGSLLVTGTGNAGSDDEKRKKAVQEIADALEQGKMDMVKTLSKKLADKEEDVYYVMYLMKPRDKKGFGVGKSAGDVIPDGIELKIQALGRDVISVVKLKKESDALLEMCHRIDAIAHFAEHLPPAKDKGKATKKNWQDFIGDMHKATAELEKAIKGGAPAEVKKAASKVNTNCNNCHSIFKPV